MMGNCWAQQPVRQNLKGKISTEADAEGLYIINMQTEASAEAKKEGYFSIEAAEGDTLIFTGIQIVSKKVALTKADFEKELFIIKLEAVSHLLDEVIVVRQNQITSESLGLVPKGQKKYTPAERKLNTASNPYATLGVGTNPGASAGLDPVLNWMSGRTAMLKKEAEVEKLEYLIEVVSSLFEEKYFAETLKIPGIHILGFKRYMVLKQNFASAIKQRSLGMASFIMAETAVEYLEIIQNEGQ
jgi:hypothetical protein